MADFLWHWKNGNSKVFTRRFDVAQKAMNKGRSVWLVRVNRRVFKK